MRRVLPIVLSLSLVVSGLGFVPTAKMVPDASAAVAGKLSDAFLRERFWRVLMRGILLMRLAEMLGNRKPMPIRSLHLSFVRIQLV